MKNKRKPIAWTSRLLLAIALMAGQAMGQGADPLTAAVNAHGSGMDSVVRIRMRGLSLAGGATKAITISAALIGVDAGSLRVDYGSPVTQSFFNTPAGAAETVEGKPAALKPPHVGAFAQFDILSGLGIRHLSGPNVQRSVTPSVVSGRAASKVRAVTERTKTIYRRPVPDDVDVDIDTETGLVAAITRRQFSEGSMDLTFSAGFQFSDYRRVQGVLLPFHIDRVLEGVVRETITLEDIELNPPLPSVFFELPHNGYRRNPVGKMTLGGH